MPRILTYNGYGDRTITVDLDYRADPMWVQNSIIMFTHVSLGLPLVVEAMIKPDGEIVVRNYQWSNKQENTYWHCDDYVFREKEDGRLVLTDAQIASIWRLWANEHPFRQIHDNGVGGTLQRLTGISLSEAERYLSRMPFLA